MTITNSNDIVLLLVQATFDLSGTTPVIRLVNLSQGNNLAGCTWAFNAYSPSLTPIHDGNINAPDITGTWSSYTLNDPWPKNPFNSYQVEWSGSPYQFFVTVKDSAGNVYTTQYAQPQSVGICPPPDVTEGRKSYFGIASSNVTVKCNDGAVFFQDNTNFTYKGNAGTKITSRLIVSYPLDSTGSRQANFDLIAYSSALVPVTINSPSYSFIQNSVYDYDFGNYVHVRINYNLEGSFGVWCGIDLLPLNAVINKYFYKVEKNEFADMASAQKRGLLILAEYSLIVAGILQPLSGAIDIPNHILRIEQLTGFECFNACCGAQSGIIPQQITSVIGGYNFAVNPLGGDVAGSFSTTGNNITLNIGDVKYIVDVSLDSPSTITALRVTPQVTGGGYTKYYHLSVDGITLATELATIIGSNVDVYNLWKALFNSSTSFKVAVDGACIFTTTTACDYTFNLANIPANPNSAILTTIKVGNTIIPINYSFNLSSLSSLQAYLNATNIGVFTITSLGGGNVQIVSLDNTHNITAINYSIANIMYTADLNKACTGYEEKEVQDVLQEIIYYICSLDDSQVITSDTYDICYLDATGMQQVMTVAAGVDLSVFIAALLEAGCTTVSYIKNSGGGVNCGNMQTLFVPNTSRVDANTRLYGYKNGCAGMTPLELFQYMLTLTDATTKMLFCNYVASCGAGLTCEEFGFNLLVTDHDTACSAIVGILYTLE